MRAYSEYARARGVTRPSANAEDQVPVRASTLVALAHLAVAMPVWAQDSSEVSVAITPLADSVSWNAGREEGHRSANEAVVAHRGVIGFAMGLPVGFFAVPAAVTFHPMLIAGEALGVASVVAVGRVGKADLPEHLAERAAERGPDYERGMREGYAERLRFRRMKAAAGGATAGMVAGAGLLVWALLHSD